MRNRLNTSYGILGVFIFLGLWILGYTLGESFLKAKKLDRVLTLKGLAENEVKVDVVLWPIYFKITRNDLSEISASLERDNSRIIVFLKENGMQSDEVTVTATRI